MNHNEQEYIIALKNNKNVEKIIIPTTFSHLEFDLEKKNISVLGH